MKIFILSVLWAIPAYAAAVDLSHLVKVESYACESPLKKRIGSGEVFVSAGRQFVLTSDHVIFHGDRKQGLCHRVLRSDGGASAKLVAVNLLYGAALLVLEQPLSGISTTEAQMLSAPSLRAGEQVSIAGFPFASSSYVKDDSASILSPDSTRKLLPRIVRMLELHGHSEFGMSGGGVWDARGNFAGMISHQFLRIARPGQIPEPVEYDASSGMGAEMITVAVPAAELAPWIRQALTDTRAASVALDPGTQLSGGGEVLLAEKLRFKKEACARPSSAAPVGGTTGDGAGIGGSDLDELKGCSVTVSFYESATAALPQPYSAAFEKLKGRVVAGQGAKILGAYFEGRAHPINGVTDLMNWISLGGLPLYRLTGPFDPSAGLVDAVKVSTQLLAITDLFTSAELESIEGADDLRVTTRLTAQSVLGGNPEILSAVSMKEMSASPAWAKLFTSVTSEKFDLVVNWKSLINRLDEIARRL